MKKIACILLAGFFLLSLSCRLSSRGDGEEFIVYAAVDKDGNPIPELVVLDAKGNEFRRINLPEEQASGYIYQVYPYLHPSHRALVFTSGGAHYLVDVLSGVVKPIQAPGKGAISREPTPLSLCPISGYGDQYWALLCGSDNAYLVNLQTAEVSADLLSGPGDQVFAFDTLFSPNEDYLALHTQEWISLLPTANPEKIRHLGESSKIMSVSFSADSKRIAYVRSEDSQRYEVVVENVDGTESSILYTSGELARVTFVPEQDQILVQEENRLLLLSLSDRAEKEFPVLSDFSLQPMFSPHGGQALVSYIEADAVHWQWLEFKRGIVEGLPELEGYQAGKVYTGQRWIILSDVTQIDEQAEIEMASVDLQTGNLQPLSTLEGAKYYAETSVSADGKFRTGIAFSTGNQAELWLLDLASGKSRRIVEDAVVSGGISPDGKWLVALSGHRAEDQYIGKIELRDTSGKILKSLGEGNSPFWVWP
jgi:hypothetical protein